MRRLSIGGAGFETPSAAPCESPRRWSGSWVPCTSGVAGSNPAEDTFCDPTILPSVRFVMSGVVLVLNAELLLARGRRLAGHVSMLILDKVRMVEEYAGRFLRSTSVTMPFPAVVVRTEITSRRSEERSSLGRTSWRETATRASTAVRSPVVRTVLRTSQHSRSITWCRGPRARTAG